MLLAALLLACSGSEAPAPAPAPPAPPPPVEATPTPEVPFELTQAQVPGLPDLRAPSAQQLQLHILPARLTLPDVKWPPKVAAITDEFVLEHEEVPNPKGAARTLKVLRAPLPFPVTADEQTFRPEGMEVTIDGVPVPFARGPAPQARRSTWRINGKQIVFSHATMPEPGAIRVRYEGVRQALDRHDPKASGLSDNDFVRTEITLGQHTRNGLVLPAPTTAEWDVQLPEDGATFEGWLAMAAGPLERPKSDGAGIILSIVSDGAETVVDRQDVEATSREYTRWRADLTAWAGKNVTVRLTTDPGATSVFDWVFVGSPTIWGPPRGEVRRVVVVAMDTTRPDRLSFFGYERPTTPEIDAFASTGYVMDHTWSTAPRTRPSFRSATTGRRPLEAVGAKNIGQVFNERGFATAGIVANVHLQPRFDFDNGFDTWQFDGRADAAQQVDRALEWLQDNLQRDSYLFLHFMDPHMVYDAPEGFRDRFVEDPDPKMPQRVKRGDVVAWAKQGELDERRKKHLEALHDGELAYTSHELGRLFDALDRMPGRTLVILHSDHGEEFWDHDGFEHNHTLYDELTRTALIIRPRGGLPEGRRIETPASLMDIGPTLFDLFGFADAPETDGHSLMPVLAGKEVAWADRPIPVAHLQYSHERWAVVWNGYKYILHTGTGREELYHLDTDPHELKDVAAGLDLEPFRIKLGEAHQIPVGPGWRVRVDVRSDASPITLTLPAPALAADILDPEAVVEHRANIEWGELPSRLPADIGTVELSEDHTVVTFHPGSAPEGVIYVLFEAPQDPGAATVSVGAQQITLEEGKRGRVWKEGDRSVLVEPGTVLIPPPTEADRMGIGPGASGADQDMKMLCELGYAECTESDDDAEDEG